MDEAIRFSETVSARLEDGVLAVTLNNPPVNAISADMRAGLLDAVRQANSDQNVRALVITGAGKAFIGGADIREFGQPATEPTLPTVIEAIEGSGKQIVAAING